MADSTNSAQMTRDQRIVELAQILARGVRRLNQPASDLSKSQTSSAKKAQKPSLPA